MIWITAYHADWDLISVVQDTTFLQSAIGKREPLDGPYDFEMAFVIISFSAALGNGQVWASVAAGAQGINTMIKAHSMHTILYGMLVTENWHGWTNSLDVFGYQPL